MALPQFQPPPQITPEDYLAWERMQEEKHEYWDGEIVNMSGGSKEHSEIISNTLRSLFAKLGDNGCRVYTSDAQVRVHQRRYVYPDITIICGEPQFESDQGDVLTNPTVLVEVLSPSTEKYDLGRKFFAYRQVESLQEYIIIHQDEPAIEHFVRKGEQWVISQIIGRGATLTLPALNCTLQLEDVYRRVNFEG